MASSKPIQRSPNSVNASREDATSCMAVCWLMKDTVQLLPLRYGLVDDPALDPSGELPLPYTLATRPLGVRLMRDGWLYVIDAPSGELAEFKLTGGLVSDRLWRGTEVHIDRRDQPIGTPTLIYSRRSTLYISYSEIQWTASKCRQVLHSDAERAMFMQAVDLQHADCISGQSGLLMPELAAHWLAENTVDRMQGQPPAASNLPEHERAPYLWEMPQRFAESSMNPLRDTTDEAHRHDVLYVLVEDDIGVLRDLANYQDQVVGWIEAWAQGGAQPRANERDYLLACYIESLTQLSAEGLASLADASDDPAIKRMLRDLQNRPEPEREHTRQALIDYLNRGGLPKPPKGSPVPPELARLQQQAYDDALLMAHQRGLGSGYEAAGRDIEDTDRRYYTREHFKTVAAEFADTHFEALITLGRAQDRRIKDLLNGARFGQRGINDLIDREAMDKALLEHRQSLTRWNTLLDTLTADRIDLLCAGRFHRSAWYYDPQNEAQVGQAFATEYACLRDICRSDEACDAVLAYLEKEPHLTRPLFHTLPYSEQTAVRVQYGFLQAAGMTLFNNLPEYLNTLHSLEASRLPALDRLADETRAVADAAQQTMSPALNRGIEKALAKFDQVLKGQPLPDLDQLFRQMPKALPARLLDAARREGVTFTVASDAERAALKRALQDVFEEKAYLKTLIRERNRVKRTAGHRSPRAQQLQVDIEIARSQLADTEIRLAGALSPMGDLSENNVRLYGATPARAGITVVFPPASQQEVAGLMRNFRNGVRTAPKANLLGDGAALVLFVVQVLNLVQVSKETFGTAHDQRVLTPFISAAMATGAGGFAAAQGVFDTALSARTTMLARGLQNHAIPHLHTQLGKLHVGLGGMTYVFGMLAAGASLTSYKGNWEHAVRRGNGDALTGAVMSMTGAGGLLTSNLYGLVSTGRAIRAVFSARHGSARTAAWASSGLRLSGVFFRANLAGALFTALEMAGSYAYNYYNTSSHDNWLQTTPWGKDAKKRNALTLDEYQRALIKIAQAPWVQVGSVEHNVWWKDLLLRARIGDIHLILPGCDTSVFLPILGGSASCELFIGAYRIITIHSERSLTTERQEIISEQIHARLRRIENDHIILCLSYPETVERAIEQSGEALLLAIDIWSPNASAELQGRTYFIRLDPRERGVFPSIEHTPLPPYAPLLQVEPLTLEVVSHD